VSRAWRDVTVGLTAERLRQSWRQLLATPALASKCYRHETDSDWTVIENDPGVSPEFVARNHEQIVEYNSESAGTGTSGRVLVDGSGTSVLYRFIGASL
jgi:hypothetical protein